MADTLQDSGFINNSYSVTIDGYAYVFDTLSQDLPVKEETVNGVTGTFAGGTAVRQQEKISGKIFAVTGTPAPAQLVRFAAAFHGYASKNWKVTDLKIDSSTGGLRSYNATVTQAASLTA